ncbi:MAG: trehalose-phosphatase [Hyphomicrobiaceae bacterium]|nr:trehalose-phosphatase [Hyphomicrobiaceae bacterium]
MTDGRAFAFFLDFDGTLVELADRPDAVRVELTTREVLDRLVAVTGGAVAIITGRDIAVVDAFLAPLKLPTAGVHGLTRRDFGGGLRRCGADRSFLEGAEALLEPLVAAQRGLLLERKSDALALHYRQRPDLEDACLAAMERVAAANIGVRLVRGKMVVEARPQGADKGAAVAAFLKESPFFGRRAVFAGDDATDEDAFCVVNAKGGISIKIGPGPTAAVWRAESTTDFLDWLGQTVETFERGGRYA